MSRETQRPRNITNWADLPEELLILVMSNLFAIDRKTFSLICRSWNSVGTISPYRHSPCLMFYQRSKQMWKFIQSNGVFYKDFPDAEICCSKYGWLLMSRDDFSLFFFNPFSNMIIELPKFDIFYTIVSFFYPPTSPYCFVLGISNLTNMCGRICHIGVLKRGEDKWTSHSYTNKCSFRVSVCTPVLHHGLVHCLDVDGRVATFDIKRQGCQSSWMVYTKCILPTRICNKIRQHFLFKIHGKKTLFAVFVAHDERKVEVFRLLEPQWKWELVSDLGDKMLFVSRFATFAETIPLKSMSNRIYFPKFHGDKGVFYSLDTRKYHTFEGDYSSNNSYDLNELDFAVWITPSATPEFFEELTWH